MEELKSILEAFSPYLVILVLVITFLAIYKNWVIPAKGMFLAVLIFIITGIISINDLLKVVSNPAVSTVLLLIIVASVLNQKFNLTSFFDKLIVHNRGYKFFLGSMMMATALLSSVMNNTAVVALMSKYVYSWGANNKISPSKLMMPLSFSAITGGMTTIIGTSTTLVLVGFMNDYNVEAIVWWKLLGMGILVSIVTIVYFLTVGHRLLPKNPDLIDNLKNNLREYLAELKVGANSELVGKTIDEGHLRNLKDFYLVEIIRGTDIITPVPPETVILHEDRLFFAGDTNNIKSLLTIDPNLQIPGSEKTEITNMKVSEVVISYNSSLIGRSIKNSGFRNRYDSAVLAVHRNGEKIRGKLGSIMLRAGDVLLLSTGSGFKDKVDVFKDIYIISSSNLVKPLTKKNKWVFFALSGIITLLLVSQILPLLTSLLIIFGLMVALNLINMRTLKRELDVNLGVILVLALAIGTAITESGASDIISNEMISLSSNLSPLVILVVMMLFTAILTTFITNVAAVSIAFPIAFSIANTFPSIESNLYLAIAFAASAAFLTPISYQTNLIVTGPGGYKFIDFLRVGGPLFILYLGTITLSLWLF